jgi:hypothetical protein
MEGNGEKRNGGEKKERKEGSEGEGGREEK